MAPKPKLTSKVARGLALGIKPMGGYLNFLDGEREVKGKSNVELTCAQYNDLKAFFEWMACYSSWRDLKNAERKRAARDGAAKGKGA